jgi:AcrR family transcriptional regulator
MFQKSPEKPAYLENKRVGMPMNERVETLRDLEPKNAGRGSYLAVLEAAAGLFGQFPVRDTTLRDILSISGVSNQTLYNYFPSGRDDVVITLYDRYQRTMVEGFNKQISSINFNETNDSSTVINKISACLGRAIFGLLREEYPLQSALFEYLMDQHLLSLATHTVELEKALARVLAQHLGDRLPHMELTRLARLCVRIVRELGNNALEDRSLGIDRLESNARLLVRTLLSSGLQEHGGDSGDYGLCFQGPADSTIVGAPISPTKKRSILERILKRRGQP